MSIVNSDIEESSRKNNNQLRSLVEHTHFNSFILTVIAINSIVLGLETSASLYAQYGNTLILIDHICLFIYVIEITLKLVVYQMSFFSSGWNNFDFFIIAIALISTSEAISIFRAFRVIRMFRLLSRIDSIRILISALIHALPKVGAAAMLLLFIFYVFGVMATNLYSESFPVFFGHLGASMFSLFQIMTLESWSMSIVRPVMEIHPYAWLFFVSFILLSSFTVLNLFIGIIVDAMNTARAKENAIKFAGDREETVTYISKINYRLESIENKLEQIIRAKD